MFKLIILKVLITIFCHVNTEFIYQFQRSTPLLLVAKQLPSHDHAHEHKTRTVVRDISSQTLFIIYIKAITFMPCHAQPAYETHTHAPCAQ